MATPPTTERLAAALREAGLEVLVPDALRGLYDDFKSPSGTPIVDLVHTLEGARVGCSDPAKRARIASLVERAKNGEFDCTREEASAWAETPAGREALRRLQNGE